MDIFGQPFKAETDLFSWRNRAALLGRRVFRRPKAASLPWPQRIRQLADRVLEDAVRRLDAFLRRCQHIIEFSQDEECILRVSLRPAPKEMTLDDRTRVRRGELIGELHFWNERLVPMAPGGADIVWGMAMIRKLRRSMAELATFAQSDPRFSRVKAFCGETAFGPDKAIDRARLALGTLGFEVSENKRPGGLLGKFVRLGEAIYLWGMIRTFNRGALKDKRLTNPTWLHMSISRKTLLRKFGPAARKTSAKAEPSCVSA